MSERCERMSERRSEWHSIPRVGFIVILPTVAGIFVGKFVREAEAERERRRRERMEEEWIGGEREMKTSMEKKVYMIGEEDLKEEELIEDVALKSLKDIRTCPTRRSSQESNVSSMMQKAPTRESKSSAEKLSKFLASQNGNDLDNLFCVVQEAEEEKKTKQACNEMEELRSSTKENCYEMENSKVSKTETCKDNEETSVFTEVSCNDRQEPLSLTKESCVIDVGKETKESCVIDVGVYTKNRAFRLFLSSKAAKKQPLVIAKDNEFDVEDDEQQQQQQQQQQPQQPVGLAKDDEDQQQQQQLRRQTTKCPAKKRQKSNVAVADEASREICSNSLTDTVDSI